MLVHLVALCQQLSLAAKAIQELAGHESLTTTQRYIHLSPAAKDAAISLLDTAGAQLPGDMLETNSTTQGKTGG
jgi:ATP-dependent Clp protease ATP-binding subunit ClpA